MTSRRGFTLIELIIVVAVIGLVAIVLAAGLAAARSRSRDAVRVADIKHIQGALELYFTDHQVFPPATGVLGAGALGCLGPGGFGPAGSCGTKPYLSVIPANPRPKGADYRYTADGTSGTYSVVFSLESQIAGLAAGQHIVDQNGIR